MASNTVRITSGFATMFAWMIPVLTASLLSSQMGLAQESANQPVSVRPRDALRLAIDLHKAGEYEKAAAYFAHAQASEQALAPAERSDLTTFSVQNSTALTARQEGRNLLRQAHENLQQGNNPDAIRILTALEVNQYLTSVDQQKRAELQRQARSAAPGTQNKLDSRALLTDGRAALQRGDFATADNLAGQAEKASSAMSSWLQPWNDTPAKLRRDIESAKAKQQPVAVARNEQENKDSWLPNVKNWFSRADKTEKPSTPSVDNMPRNPEPSSGDNNPTKNTTTVSKFMFWPFGASGAKKETDAPNPDELKARQLISDGFKAMEANKLDQAQQAASQAKELRVSYVPGEATPDQLLHEIQRRAASMKVRAQSTAPVSPTPLPIPDFVPKSPSPTPSTVSSTTSAGSITPTANIVPTPTTPVPSPSSIPNKLPADGRLLLKEGRALLMQKKYEEADKVCTMAMNSSERWGFWGDTPEKLRRDIMKARQGSDRDESVRLMAEARKLFTQSKYDDAEQKAYKAQQLHGPYGTFDFGDRPQKLLEEIHRARLNKAKELNNVTTPTKDKTSSVPPPAPATTAANPSPARTPDLANAAALPAAVPAGVMNANKNRAIVMIREARELERQGMLSEALQKALEVKALRVTFLPEEDSPDSVLLSLRGKCGAQIQATLHQVPQLVSNAADAQRFAKAQTQLNGARKLAQEFGLDPNPIDQQTNWLRQLAEGGPNAGPGAGQNPLLVSANMETPSGDPAQQQAREKLRDAQAELTRGNYNQARRMAEDLFAAKHNIQDEVMRFIRSIDAEEYNMRVLEAKRTFDAGMDAYVLKQYRKAMNIFQAIDPQLLPERYSVRLRDVMATREMQPQSVAQVQHLNPDANLGAKLNGNNEKAAEEENLLENRKRLDAVQFQALRQRGREAQKTSLDLFKNNQKGPAIDVLKQYLEQVDQAQLAPDKTAELHREAEMRIQQFQMQLAQEQLAAKEKSSKYPMFHDEGKRNEDIAKRQQEMAKLMKEAAELMKLNKLDEAEVRAKQVRQIDRENTAALAMLVQIDTKRNQANYDKDTFANEKIFLKALSTGLGTYADMEKPIVFSKEQIKRRDKNSGVIWRENTNPRERAIEYRLLQPISLHFKDTPLRDVIKTIAIQSGVQVVPDYEAFQKQNINLDAPLSLTVEEIAMKSALNLLLKQMQLTYSVDNEVLLITTVDNTSGRLHRVTYPIADLVVAPKDNPMPDVFNVQKMLERNITPTNSVPYQYGAAPAFAGNPGVPIGSTANGLGSAVSQHGSGSMSAPTGGEPQRTKEAMAAQLMELIQLIVKKNTWEQVGGQGQIQYVPIAMALVINQTQEVQEEVMQLLASLRKLQDLQVAVELRAVLVSESFFERIGVDFNMNITTPTSRNEPNLVSGNFSPFGFVNRPGAGINTVTGLTPAGTLTPDLNIPIKNNSFAFTTPQFGGYQPEAGLSLGLAFLSDIQVFMFLEAVQGDRRAHVMQAPKITVYNGQNATILALVSRTQVSTVLPTTMPNGQIIMVPQLNVISYGLGMTVQPVVSPDRRFIRLNLSPQLSAPTFDPNGTINVTVTPPFPPAFLGGAGGANPPSPNLLPQPVTVNVNPLPVSLTIVNTTVNVPDGGTVLLGGFKFLAEERSEYGPPILSSIPYLSRLFRNVGWSRDGSTLMYLVTARIIMVEEEERIFTGEQAPIPRP